MSNDGLGELFGSPSRKHKHSDEECMDHPLRWALLGLKHAGSRSWQPATTEEMSEWLGREVSDSTVKTLTKLDSARDPATLVKAVQALNLDAEDVGQAMEVADNGIKLLTHKGKKPDRFHHRYIPTIINEAYPDGQVYMCKSVNGKKAMLAWDLNPKNVIVEVENYEKYEVLGWEKLKDFPHSGRQIEKEYGDRLSDDVFEQLCGDNQKTRTQRNTPSTEMLTISVGTRDRQRFKMQADSVKESFDDDGLLENNDVARLILFPSTTDHNLTDNRWITGELPDGNNVGVANCNKGTYEYLQACDEVYHIEDYIEQAGAVTVTTSEGSMQLADINLDEAVVYTTSAESFERFDNSNLLPHLPEVLASAASSKWRAPDLTGDEHVILLKPEQAFEVRPLLHNHARVLHTDTKIRNIGETQTNIGHEYAIYAKARLGDWDWDTPELTALEEQCWNMQFEEGGYELIETLAMLHDNGQPLYSQSPARRWDNVE